MYANNKLQKDMKRLWIRFVCFFNGHNIEYKNWEDDRKFHHRRYCSRCDKIFDGFSTNKI